MCTADLRQLPRWHADSSCGYVSLQVAIRGDVNVLLVGDPGLGKSQLLQVGVCASTTILDSHVMLAPVGGVLAAQTWTWQTLVGFMNQAARSCMSAKRDFFMVSLEAASLRPAALQGPRHLLAH